MLGLRSNSFLIRAYSLKLLGRIQLRGRRFPSKLDLFYQCGWKFSFRSANETFTIFDEDLFQEVCLSMKLYKLNLFFSYKLKVCSIMLQN